MKGYILDKVCYVFPGQDAAQFPELPETVEVIYVQHEEVDAYKAKNEDNDLIKGYNYYALTVNKKDWAGHANDDLPEPQPQPVSPELAWSADAATVTIGADDNVFPSLNNPHNVQVTYTSSDTAVATIDESTGQVTLVAAGVTNLQASFAGDDTYEAQAVTYALTVNAAQPTYYNIDNLYSYDNLLNDTEVYTATEGTALYYSAKTGVDLYNDYDVRVADNRDGTDVQLDAPTSEQNGLGFTMPASDVTVYIDLKSQEPDPEEGTVYDFVGYLTEDAQEPSSTGQITYEGEYSEDTDYVYGIAEVTFTGSDNPQELTVYMTKEGFFTTLDGGRAEVFTITDNAMTSIGYGELTEHNELEDPE